MNLTTNYLGLPLRTPLVPSASPLTQNFDNIKRLEDAGAAAIIFHSLFEEQIRLERSELFHYFTEGTESYPEALTYMPEPIEFKIGPERYVENLARAKARVGIPVIASLNGTTEGGWIHYARQLEQAGADALELNLYWIPTDFEQSAYEIEHSYVQILRDVKSVVSIPVAVKLSPYFTNFGRMAKCLEGAGADGLVLFNRFYQPDIDPENMEITPNIRLSTPMTMRLPMTWIGLLHGRVRLSLAATSGVHRAIDVVKLLMAGADITQLCSVLLRNGINHIRTLEADLARWLHEHDYASVEQLKGSMSQRHCADPTAYERALYLYSLHEASEDYSRRSTRREKAMSSSAPPVQPS